MKFDMTTFQSVLRNGENAVNNLKLTSSSYNEKRDPSVSIVPVSKKMTVQSSNIGIYDSYLLQVQSKYDGTLPTKPLLVHSALQTVPSAANGTLKLSIMDSEKAHAMKAVENSHGDMSQGLCNMRAILFLTLWYFFSFTTLFMNKYILAYRQGDPTVLGIVQMFSCALCGYLHLLFPCGLYKKSQQKCSFKYFFQMSLVGSLRFSTVFLGLIALWYVPVSFAETVKSSAPVFTVAISRAVLGERTSLVVMLSLIPVMGGLALCSANELSFNTLGFIAAVATNLSECFQNVFSKMLLSGEKTKFSPPELQCYSGLASFGVQVPVFIIMVNFSKVWASLNSEMIMILALGGISFHCQSLMEYTLLGYISPVTHSVANTTKRALLIWLSVLTFGNKVTFLSGLGTSIVILGVMFYNKAQQWTFKPPMQSTTSLIGTKEGVHTI